MTSLSEFYRKMLLIRRFDEKVLDQFSSGLFHGTTHTYLGQEANAVIISNLAGDDLVFSNHRCHGHYLAYGGTPHSLFAELMGRSTGICGGRGGSQHIHWKNFYSSGVQGSLVPTAVGAALAEKLKDTDSVAVSFIGDGTLGQGVVYESLNMASLWSAPVLFVVENNRIAQTTPIELSLAGNIPSRFTAFGINTIEIETSDVETISTYSSEMLAEIRHNKKPQALILHTYRFGPHSKGDDTRDPEDIQDIIRRHDPLTSMAERLEKDEIDLIHAEVKELIETAFEKAKSDPLGELI